MADYTTRQDILEALMAQLATVTYPANAAVVYWDVLDQDYNGPPMITVRDPEEETSSVNTLYNQSLTLEIEAIAYTTQANKLTDSCALLESLKDVVVRSDWVPQPAKIHVQGSQKDIEEGGKIAIRVLLTLVVEYRDRTA